MPSQEREKALLVGAVAALLFPVWAVIGAAPDQTQLLFKRMVPECEREWEDVASSYVIIFDAAKNVEAKVFPAHDFSPFFESKLTIKPRNELTAASNSAACVYDLIITWREAFREGVWSDAKSDPLANIGSWRNSAVFDRYLSSEAPRLIRVFQHSGLVYHYVSSKLFLGVLVGLFNGESRRSSRAGSGKSGPAGKHNADQLKQIPINLGLGKICGFFRSLRSAPLLAKISFFSILGMLAIGSIGVGFFGYVEWLWRPSTSIAVV